MYIEKRVIELRKQNIGYKRIANEIGVNRDKVRYICQQNGLTGVIGEHNNNCIPLEERELVFKENFEISYPQFKYHSSYITNNDLFKCECRVCKHIQERSAGCLRKNQIILCNKCEELKRKRKELINLLAKRYNEITKEQERQIRKKEIYNQRQKDLITACEECGKIFKGTSIGMKYCSKRCATRMGNRNRDRERYHNIIENGTIDKDITLTKLIKRDKGICHICGEQCNRKEFMITEEGYFIVGENYPSIDHVVPISRGGTHTWDNIRLAHHYCNTIKNNKEVYEDGSGQLTISI